MLKEKELSMELFRAGDRITWERVYHDLSKRVFLFVDSLVHDTALAEDLTQESMGKLWNMRYRIDSFDHLKGFLFMIARNTCLNALRYKKRHPIILMGESLTEIESLPSESDSYLAEVRYEVLLRVLVEQIELLPPKQKEIFQLYIKGISFPKIADQMGVAVSTIRNQFTAGRWKISEKLKLHP
jgi:RNA polymerase sigma-70 factor (ECF subfamily)